MAVGKEIKVTLSLDDSGFSVKTKGAGDAVRLLEKNLGSLTSQTGKTEAAIAEASGSLKGFADGFGALQKSLASSVSSLTNTVASSFSQLAVQGKTAAKQANDAATAQIDAKMRVLKTEIETNRQLLQQRGKMHADLRKVESDANAKALALEMEADKVRRSKKAGSGAAANDLQQEAARYRASAQAIREQVAAAEQWITVARTEQATRNSLVASLESERVAALADAQAKRQLASVAASVGRSNDAEMQRIRAMAKARDAATQADAKKAAEDFAKQKKGYADQEVRDAKAAEAARTAAAREAAAERRRIAAQEAVSARAEAKAIADLWKGMAQMYADSKIEGGIKASIGTADQYQREQTAAASLNLSPKELAEVNQRAWDDSKVLKFASALDMIQARLAAIGGLGENNVGFIDKTLQYASTAAHNMQYITGDHSAEAARDMVRNIYGVIEARQQTNDPEAAKRTIDLIQKMYVGTGKKIDIKDLETYLRRDNTGADKITDEGIARMVAFLDQAKVSGGGMGGAGVSTVGTMVKMFQKMANGGMMTVGGAQEFAEAGLMDLSVMDGKKGKDAMRALRSGGLNVAALANEDPVTALETISKAALAYMSKPENLKKFFPDGADPKDPNAIKNAMMKFAVGTGWSTNAVAMLTTAGNSAAMERAHAQANTVMNSKNTTDMNAEVMKTYGANVDAFNKAVENLKITVGNSVLPVVTKLFEALSGIVKSAQDFAANNPIATQLTVIGAAAAGALLSIKGFTSMFGAMNSAASILRTIIGGLGGAGAAAQAAGGQAIASGGAWAALTGHFNNVWASVKAGAMTHMPALNASVLGMAASINGGGSAASRIALGFRSIGTAATSMAKIVGKAFLRMIPLVGELLMVWDFANVVAGIEVFGARIDTWLISFLDRFMTKAANFKEYVKSLFTGDDEGYKKAVARNNADLQQRLATMGVQFDSEKPAAAKPAAPAAPKPAAHPVKTPEIKAPSAAQLAQIKSAAAGEGDKADRDPLLKALGEADSKLNEQKEKLKSLVDGAETVDALRKQADALIRGKWEAADYTPNHDKDPKKRPDWNGDQMKQLRDKTLQEMLSAEQIKAIEFANERVAAGATEINAAMERIADDGAPKQTDAFRALNRELERAKVRLGAGATEFLAWRKAKNMALFEQAGADAANYAADLHASNKKDKIDLLPTERERTQAQLKLTRDTDEQTYQIRRDNLEKWKTEAINSILAEGPPTKKAQDRITEIINTATQVRDQIDKEAANRREIRRQQEILAQQSAASKMAIEWKDAYKSVDEIGGNTMNSFVSMLTNSLSTGRLAVGDFVKGVLMDIANAKLKQVLADPLKDMVNSGASWVGKNVFGLAGGSGDATASAAATSRATADTAAATATTAMSTSIMSEVIPALQMFAENLMNSGGGGGGFLGSLFGGSGAGSDGAWSGAASAEGLLDFAGYAANGGILTADGFMSLRKYANGGIANSPQVAIYGEAGPEAFVPLPDGRTIPVTMNMQGGGQQPAVPSVSVNVINQTGQQVNAQQGNVRFDGRQYVLDVVMTAVQTPGPFRSSMKEAMK